MKKSSKSPRTPPTSFSSLPFDVALNCLARVSRIHNPTLFLVSKNLRSLIASPELEATRSRIGITEDHLFVCLDLNKNNPNPSWFILSSTPKQQILLPIPPFPYQHPKSSTILLVDYLIYIIGGLVNGQSSNKVLILNCLSHQWRSTSDNIKDWGEVFDPKTQTWEPILPTTLDLTTQKSVVPDRLVMGGKVYAMDGLKLNLKTNICLVEKVLRLMSSSNHSLYWNDPTEDFVWRFHYPTLSLVSKGFRSIIASPELETTRSRMGITEDHLCVFIDLNKKNPNPRWFLVSPIPTQKSKPIPSFPHQYPKSSTIVSNGSKIYIIGGFVRRKRSKRVLILDCRSQQCRRLPNMRLPRVSPAADVIDGQIYVIGGYESNNIDEWGEVYDPKTQTWEPLLPTTLDLTVQKSEVPGKLVMGGKVYAMDDVLLKDVFLVEIENVLCQISLANGYLLWRDPKADGSGWSNVLGLKLEELSPYQLYCVGNSGGERRVKVWWESVVTRRQGRRRRRTNEFHTEIWCAEVSFERRGLGELWGFVEWS
ncbi:unnamed protein product, partial [Arabidopsis halleri]